MFPDIFCDILKIFRYTVHGHIVKDVERNLIQTLATLVTTRTCTIIEHGI